MANTNSSGIISLTDVQSQFGGAAPISILEYLAGNSHVGFGHKNAAGVLIPSSPPMSLANFYGIGVFANTTNSHSVAGAFTETSPPGAVFVQIEVVGASGGGGGGSRIAKGQIFGGGGAGSGAISRSAKLLITANAVTIKGNVGAAGAAGANATLAGGAGSAGTAGGASNVQSGTFVINPQTAAGGGPGLGSSGAANGTGGAGGTATGTGATLLTGNAGAAGNGANAGGLGGAALIPSFGAATLDGGDGGTGIALGGRIPLAGGVGAVYFHYTNGL